MRSVAPASCLEFRLSVGYRDMLLSMVTLLFVAPWNFGSGGRTGAGGRHREEGRSRRSDAHADPTATPRGIARTSRPSGDVARDVELLGRLRAGDETALTAFVRTYAERLRDFAYLTVRDADLAADIVQDVFVWLWEHRLTMVVGGTVADYLYRATRNRALNVVKHERAQDRVRMRLGEQYVINSDAALAAAADGPLVAREFGAAVDRALRGLTPRVRETFLLAHVEHMTYDEIATLLSVSVNTVQSQLSRAVKHLRAQLLLL